MCIHVQRFDLIGQPPDGADWEDHLNPSAPLCSYKARDVQTGDSHSVQEQQTKSPRPDSPLRRLPCGDVATQWAETHEERIINQLWTGVFNCCISTSRKLPTSKHDEF